MVHWSKSAKVARQIAQTNFVVQKG